MPDAGVKRRYDASGRRRHAARRRSEVVRHARARFESDGFAGTTVAAVAGDAGVSVEMIYKTFGGKAGLVRAVWDQALEGRGPTPAEERSDAMSRSTSTGPQIISGWLRLALEVAPRAAPVIALVRSAAAVDAEAARLLEEIDRGRAERMEHNARVLADGGHLHPDLSIDQARDLLLVFSAEFHPRLVGESGWDPDDYVRVMTRTMSAALLRDDDAVRHG